MKILFSIAFIFSQFLFADEELIVTGSYINNSDSDLSPIEIFSIDDYRKLNTISLAEISRYVPSVSGSHFQTNAMDGEDQGLSSITLRGLGHASTLLLINTKRQTFSGTPSREGEGYIDANIIPDIAVKKIEIFKEGATSLYGSDAVAGVVNVITYKDFEGFLFRTDNQFVESYSQNDNKLGFLYGVKEDKNHLVLGLESFFRSPLSAKEIKGIADLSISTFGKTFITTESEEILSGDYQGSYSANEKIPDPNCEINGGLILGGFCKFAYGERFNIINKERHNKGYLNLTSNIENSYLESNELILIYAKVDVLDNPQSPSYPALPFISRNILPDEGGSPFKNEIKWRGRPLGANYPSPNSTKDISQYHITNTLKFSFKNSQIFELSVSQSSHNNLAIRPDIINSRFLDALQGKGGEAQDKLWNLFSDTNSSELVEYIKGNLIAEKGGALSSLDGIFLSSTDSLNYSTGFQIAKDVLDIKYNDLGRIEIDSNGSITKQADLFFLGGGTNVSQSRSKVAAFVEINQIFSNNLDLRFALRYENFSSQESLDPKISIKYQPSDVFALRFSSSSSFTMPSMAQMYGSDIVLGSVRDVTGSVFVRQGQIGNPNLKPAKSINTNLGFLIFPSNTSSISFDFFDFRYKDRIEAESAQAMVLNNPSSPSISRNSSGEITGVTASYINEERSFINGLDFSANVIHDFEKFGSLNFKVSSTTLFYFLTPHHHVENNNREELIDRVGKFNYDAHTHSLPKNKINIFLSWNYNEFSLDWASRYVSGYSNERVISDYAKSLGYTNEVDEFLVHDISITRSLSLETGKLDLKFGIINFLNQKAPRLYDAPDFSFDTRLHDPTGRTYNFSIQYQL